MILDDDEARRRLEGHDHGVLSTLHLERGVDAVPCVYAIADDDLGIPVDRVKPKSSTWLQREKNLEADPRAVLLVQQWDPDDWSRLWWVRVHLRWRGNDVGEREAELSRLLGERYEQYADEPFERVCVLRITGITGWSASD